LSVLFVGAGPAVAQAERLLGFTSEGSDAQRQLEAQFDAALASSDIQSWVQTLAARPHHVGSNQGRANVETLAGLFEGWGYDVEIASYRVLFPTPKRRRLRMLEPVAFEAALTEAALEGDASTADPDVLPPYNAFSPDGDVTGELVFVNYGLQDDYERLARFGVDVAGKVVIAKYGRSWRGIKPKLAAEHGAIGALMYSDPADDGFAQGEVYPAGAFKHATGVQRGSVMDLPVFAGDVLTPGTAATRRARRLKRADSPGIAKIPVLPISAADAQPLLEALAGPVAPADWRGALPLTYRLGPGAARVRLEVEFDWRQVDARNVIATLPGTTEPELWVIRGNHHDSWNHGAADPTSGVAAMLAEAKAIAGLEDKPRRTVVFAAWDAEEPGLMGSTEWVEEHAAKLSRQAVAYINTDSNGRGFLRMGGSSTLGPLLQQVARDVNDPQVGVSVADRLAARVRVAGTPEQRSRLSPKGALPLAPLGSGSDFTPFLQHLGIASVNMGFGGENAGGSYHSLYDTVAHYERFGDPDYAYGVTLAKVAGRATLRLANAAVLPFDPSAFSRSVAAYLEDIDQLAGKLRDETARTHAMLEAGDFDVALDPSETFGAPVRQDAVPHLNLAPLENAVADLQRAAREYRGAVAVPTVEAMDPLALGRLNDLLFRTERALLDERGLPERPWYRHQIYAPGYYTGYGAKTLPALREAIEQRDFEAVEPAVTRIAAVLARFTAQIDAASTIWRSGDLAQE
jgi:N-acetylated-alpha-linked acidic dipeptidase